MSLMSMVIAGACATSTGNGQEACGKSLEAYTKQSGIESNVDFAETKYTKKVNKTAYGVMGQTGMDVVGGSLFIAKAAADKKVSLGLPTLGICDHVTSEAGVDKYGLKLEWGF